MRPSSCKAKGQRLQKQIAADLCTAFNLATDDVRSCSSGAHGEDVQLSAAARARVPWSIEAKNVEKLNFRAAFEQAKRNAGAHTPVLVSKCNHEDALCTMRWSDALALLVRAQSASSDSADDTHDPTHLPPAPQGTAAFLRALAERIDE